MVTVSAQASQQVNKKKVNYASMTCGAKLVVANPEAKNAASILNENKDQYMIQPCQAKKWLALIILLRQKLPYLGSMIHY